MFDRIAGVYDRMNTVMTAGLHHQWRRRAADLAALAPGRPGARRGHRHRRPGVRAGAPRRAGRRGRRRRLLGADARAGARQGGARARARRRRACASSRPTRSRCPTPTASSTPPRSASARATSPTSTAGLARWPGWSGPAAGWWCSRSPRRTRPPLSTFFELWFDRVVPALGRLAGDAEAYSYLPSSVRRFPRPRGAGRGHVGLRAARRSATC